MGRRKRASAKKEATRKSFSSRPIWKGSINFGLVNIPVALHSAETSADINFDLLDRRDFSPIRYRRVNEKTGREVPWDEIVKGYEYKKGEYVALSDDDFRSANVEATQSIDITDFVDAAEISPVYYDKPYYLVPLKNGERAYTLLRDVLSRTGKVAIGKIVIRTRQHLAAVFPQGPLLVVNLLRFPHELRDPQHLGVRNSSPKRPAASPGEVKMAEQLVDSMMDNWNPEKYHDEYREDLLNLIEKKIKSGQTKILAPKRKAPERKREDKVVDIMHLLRRSVEQARKPAEPRRKAG
jgi:DNA end-binding protein Ku